MTQLVAIITFLGGRAHMRQIHLQTYHCATSLCPIIKPLPHLLSTIQSIWLNNLYEMIKKATKFYDFPPHDMNTSTYYANGYSS